jgi:hypothetical protein
MTAFAFDDAMVFPELSVTVKPVKSRDVHDCGPNETTNVNFGCFPELNEVDVVSVTRKLACVEEPVWLASPAYVAVAVAVPASVLFE